MAGPQENKNSELVRQYNCENEKLNFNQLIVFLAIRTTINFWKLAKCHQTT